jgi:hypothetical protein
MGGDCTMPAYAFEIRWNGGEKTSWTYLPSHDSARDFARILIRGFKDSGQYRGSALMAVRDDHGTVIASIEF